MPVNTDDDEDDDDDEDLPATPIAALALKPTRWPTITWSTMPWNAADDVREHRRPRELPHDAEAAALRRSIGRTFGAGRWPWSGAAPARMASSLLGQQIDRGHQRRGESRDSIYC